MPRGKQQPPGRVQQLAIKEIARDRLTQTQRALRHLVHAQPREVSPQRLQHRLLLNQAIFVHEEPGPIAHHDHIVVKGSRLNGTRVLAHEEGSVRWEVAQTRHAWLASALCRAGNVRGKSCVRVSRARP